MAKRCEQCSANGISLFPMRIGYMINENKKLHYNPRLIREGYIYILDDKGKWYGYVVTKGRYLEEFNVNSVEKKFDLPYIDSTCHKGNNCSSLLSFIRIPNPNNKIKTLWVAYSPVKWTKKILSLHKKDNDAKSKNMVKVPVSITESKSSASISPKDKDKLYGFYNFYTWGSKGVGHFSAEYSKSVNPYTQKYYQPNKLSDKDQLKETLSQHNKRKRVLNIYFNDPVGKLIDLNELMINTEDYCDSKLLKSMSVNSFETLYHKAFIANTILDLENQIKSNAPAYAAKRKLESLSNPHGSDATLLTSTEDLAQGYYKNNWEEGFKKFIRYDEMKRWSSRYKKANNSNNINRKEILANLAEAYNQELLSENLKAEMTYNFDNGDIDSCASYTLTVQEFIGSTAKYSIIAKNYTAMLTKNSLLDKRNYLGRAYCFNNESMINQVENKSKGITISGILTLSWSAAAGEVLSVIKNKYLTKLKDYGTTITLEHLTFDTYLYARKIGNDKLITSTAYPNIKLGRSDLLMSIFTRRPLSVVTVEGNIKEITKGVYGLLKTELSKNGGSQLSNNKLKGAATQFVEQMKSEGIDIDKNISTKVTAFVSIDALTSANGAKSSAGVAKSMMTGRKLQFDEFKVFYKSQASQSGAGNFGGVLQVLSCLSLFGGVIDSAGTDAKEPLHKFGASIAILAGGVVQHRADVVGLRRELYGAVPTNSPHRQAKLDRMVKGNKRAYSTLKVGARSLNIGGAAVFAYYDYQAAMTNYDNDDLFMGRLYAISAGSGIVSTGLLVSGASVAWVPVAGWVILGVSIVAGLAIMWFQKTPLEKWVKYGTWGIDSNGWSLDFEQAQLEKASEGIEIDIKDN